MNTYKPTPTAKTVARDAEIVFAPHATAEDRQAVVESLVRFVGELDEPAIAIFSVDDAERSVDITV